jgi:hypothetical protein
MLAGRGWRRERAVKGCLWEKSKGGRAEMWRELRGLLLLLGEGSVEGRCSGGTNTLAKPDGNNRGWHDPQWGLTRSTKKMEWRGRRRVEEGGLL